MKAFFEWTAWEMEKPTTFGTFHLLFTLIGIPLVIFLAFLLRKLSEKQNRIMLLCIGIFLMLFELYKQLFYFFVIHDGGYYPLWILPFQLCSVPMYLCVICACCKNRKFNSWLYDFMFAFNLFGGLITFIEPSGINHPYVMLTLHAYIWHISLIFLGFYFFFSKRACTNWKGYFKGLAVFGVMVAIAQIINICTQGQGGCNMFYISPYNNSPLAFFKEFSINNGWVANMFLYLFALVLAGSIIYYLAFLIRWLYNRKKNKQPENKDYAQIALDKTKEGEEEKKELAFAKLNEVPATEPHSETEAKKKKESKNKQ